MAGVLKGESKYPRINQAYIKDNDHMRTCVDTWFTQGMGAKFFYMRTWLQNINFHAGNQWLIYDKKKQIFELEPILEDDRIKLTINKVLPAIRMAVGKVAQDRKRPIVIHRTQDEDAIEAAKVATKLLEHHRRISDGEFVEKAVITWGALCGKGVTKKWFDTETNQVRTEVIPPFEYIVPPNVLNRDKMPWACHARFETREWVYETYGLDVPGSSDWGQYGMFLSAVKNIMEVGNYTGVFTQGMEDNVLVKDWWIRPCKEYPQGALIIEVGDQIVYADKNPFSDAEDDFYWPFAEFDFFDAPYRYWPISLVETLIDPQKWINEFYSDNIENLQYSNSPAWWAQEGAVNADEVSMKPGQVNFHAGPAPTPVVTRGIDPVVFTQIEKLEQVIGDLSGIHMFGPGSLPPGVHAAAALAIINEQDQIAAMAVDINWEKWVRDDAAQTLYLIRKWGPSSLYLRVMGQEQQWETVEFKRDYLHGDEEIHIESKQELASDKMTKFEQVLKLMTTLGGDGKPLIDTDMGLRLLDLEKDMGIVTPRMLNRNMQMSENEKLWKGQGVEVYEFEDHREHMEACLEEMLTSKFKEAPAKVREAFITHYKQHESYMNAAQTSGENSSQIGQTPQAPQPGQPGAPPQGGMPPQGPPQGGPPSPMGGPPQSPMGGLGMSPMQSPMGPQQSPLAGLSSGLQSGMANAQGIAGGRR